MASIDFGERKWINSPFVVRMPLKNPDLKAKLDSAIERLEPTG
jgi:hypothetical protein